MNKKYSTVDYKSLYEDMYREIASMLLGLPEEGSSKVELLHSWDSLRRVFDKVTYDR